MNKQRQRLVKLLLLLSCTLLASNKPNVIVVLADDLGLGDVSSYRRLHSDSIILETPNIDLLAKQGMMFTQAHSPAALCAPSRYAIMTGNSCYRSYAPWGVWGAYEKSPVKDSDLTLGRLMQKAGYHTSFFGKWHLGGDYKRQSDTSIIYRNPRMKNELDVDVTHIVKGAPEMGFDYSLVYPAGIQAEPYMAFENNLWYKWNENSKISHITNEKIAPRGYKLDKKEGLGDSEWDAHDAGPLLINKAVDYIDRQANKGPFFMYYCSQAVHVPHTPCVELDGVKIKGTTPSAHMDMIKELDVQMGMLIKRLKQHGIYENTVFIFTSDNGGLSRQETIKSGHQSSDIYRGHKNLMYEGGHRVPFIVSYPSQIKPGSQCNDLIQGLDIMATLAAITKTKIPEGTALDSYNLWPTLQQKKKAKAQNCLLLQSGTGKQVIIIENEMKLIIQVDKKDKSDNTRTPIALFNIKENPSELEEQNLINKEEYQDVVKALSEKYNNKRAGKTN